MTIASPTRGENSYTATGASAVYPYTFPIYNEEHLQVIITSPADVIYNLTLSTDGSSDDFSLSGVRNGSGGNVTLLDNGQDWITAGFLTIGWRILILRTVPFTQLTNLRGEGGYNPGSNEQEMDLLTMALQQLEYLNQRTLRLPESEGAIDPLPGATLRANGYQAYDASGNPIISASLQTVPVETSTMTVATMAALRALARPANPVSYLLKGYYAAGDGGGGIFLWNSTDSLTDDGGTIIQPNAGGTGRWNRMHEGTLNVRWFGAKGDGSTNDTAAVQLALDAAAAGSFSVFFPKCTSFKVTSVLVKNGTKAVFGPGMIQDSGVSGSGVVVLDGPNALGGTAVQHCYISLRMSMSSGATFAIFADKALYCTFEQCFITGFTDTHDDEAGIRLSAGSKGNVIRGNRIIFTNGTPTHGQGGIVLVSNSTAYGGYFTGSGVTTDATLPCSQNVITGNYVYGGSHGITGNGLEDSVINGNTLEQQRDRSIILEPVCNRNAIVGNTCKNFGSSGVSFGYGGRQNVIANNTCESLSAGGEAALQAYVGPVNNLFIGNTVKASTNYGVYIAVNADGNRVIGNSLAYYRLAAIALECDWNNPLPGGATYSRPNYGAPPSGSQWAFSNTQSNQISENQIYDGNGGNQCGIYLGQLLANGNLNDNEISRNKIHSTALTKYIMVFEETASRATNNKMMGNTCLVGTAAKFSFTRGRAHFNFCQMNETMDIGTTSSINFADADATPSVAIGGLFNCSNTAPTNVTNFDDGIADQEIVVRLDANTTIKYDVNKIRLKGAVDAAPASSNAFMKFRLISSIWFEITRNF